jgi:hypothetical protein
VVIENATWRLVVVPGSNGKVVEMTYKPAARNVIRPHRAFNRFRYEAWVRDGAGPAAYHILAYEVVSQAPDRVALALTTEDGSRFERQIALVGDAVRFDTTVSTPAARSLDLWVHPEYDAATTSPDPRVVRIYVRAGGGWVQANEGWRDGLSNSTQESLIRSAAAGGEYAYYTTAGKFGVEQRFDPAEYRELGLFWGTERQQVNLDLMPRERSLSPGGRTHYGYEVRYLASPPIP